MTPDLDALDQQRTRWAVERRRANLLADLVDDETFATGGLGARVPGLSARIMILPIDPLAHKVTFDEELAAWWAADHPDPILGGAMDWGNDRRLTAEAFLRGQRFDGNAWYRYVALHRNGAIDVGLSDEGGLSRDERRFVLLTPLVARIWASVEMFRRSAERIGLGGPVEFSIGIRNTGGARLSALAQGWNEAYDWRAGRECQDRALLLRRELLAVDEVSPKTLAFDIGRQVENAFGSAEQRFIARDGQHQGQIDPRHCRWG